MSVNNTVSLAECWKEIGVWGRGDCPELQGVSHCRNCPVYSSAAKRLLDAPAPEEYLQAWARHIAVKKNGTQDKNASAFLFRVHQEWLALPSAVIHEVSPPRPIHSLPHRKNDLVLGLANIRGELLLCLSLARTLRLEEESNPVPPAQQRLLGVKEEGRRLVFPVSEIFGIWRYHPSELLAVPATLSQATAKFTRALLPWKNHSVGLLEAQLLFHTLNRSIA